MKLADHGEGRRLERAPGLAAAASHSSLEAMKPRRKEVGNTVMAGVCGALGLAATAVMSGCTLDAIAAPEDAMVSGQEAVEVRQGTAELSVNRGRPSGKPAEVATADGDGSPGSPRMMMVTACTADAELPLFIIDGARSHLTFSEIAVMDIVSFEIVTGSDAVAEYGEEGRRGVIEIVTREPGGGGNGDSRAGEPRD